MFQGRVSVNRTVCSEGRLRSGAQASVGPWQWQQEWPGLAPCGAGNPGDRTAAACGAQRKVCLPPGGQQTEVN